MDDQDFDRAAEIIFNGVPSLERFGCPGVLIPLTNDTRAVLCGEDSNNVIIVATRFSQGRCLVFAHNSYPEIFLNTEEKHRQFVDNCRQWLTRGYQAEFVSINDAETMQSVPTHGKILVWDGHHTKSDAFMNDLVETIFRLDWHGFIFVLVCFSPTWRCIGLRYDSLGLVTRE